METGQVSILVAGCLLLSLIAGKSNRPYVAGICLAIAAIKPSTTLPFLILFLTAGSWKTWITLGAVTLGLCLVTTPAGELPRDLGAELEQVRIQGRESGINYHGYVHNNSDSRIGIDHALYRIGLRSDPLISALQMLVVITLGGYLALEVSWLRRLPDEVVCSLVCLYSMIFLYHRIYDTVILVVPLAFVMAAARRAVGAARWLFALSGLAQLVAIHPIGRVLKWIQEDSWGWGVWGSFSRGIVLPGTTWAIVGAMTALGLAAWLDGRRVNERQLAVLRGADTPA